MFSLIWYKGRWFQGLCDRHMHPQLLLCVLTLPQLPTSTALQVPAVGNSWPIHLVRGAWSILLPGGLALLWDKHQLQRSEWAGFWRGFSYSALQTSWESGVPFMFPFHLSLERARKGLHVAGSYWCWLQIHFKLISTLWSWASNSHCVSLVWTLL